MFVPKTLAALHARSLILKLNKPTEFDTLMEPLKEAVFPQDELPSLGKSIDTSLLLGVKYLKSIENPDNEILKMIDFLNDQIPRAFETLKDLVLEKKEKYHVLTHGDAWNNNIVFKHDENGGATDVKLLDYQIVRHASPAIDFHYFVYSSAQNSVINESYEHLVKTYQSALIEELRRLGAPINVLTDLSVEWFKNELKRLSLYGLFTSFWLVNAVLAEDDEIMDMDTLTSDFIKNPPRGELPIRPKRLERMVCICRHYCRTYL